MEPDPPSGQAESRILWDESADQAMSQLEGDSETPQLLGEVRRILAMLEADPGQADVRRKRFQNGLWAVPVRGDDRDWLILWEPLEEQSDEVVIRYLGPTPGG
jgi:hypothetical protein